MKKIRILLVLWAVVMLAVGAAMGEEPAQTNEQGTAASEQPSLTETETREVPDVINRVSDPQAGEGFSFPEDARILHIWFPNIMNADEAILIYEDEVWMIDCGDEKMGARGATLLGRLVIDRIDKLLITHPHHDHLNGLKVTNETASVKEILICYGEKLTAREKKNLGNALSYAEEQGIPVDTFGEGTFLTMGEGAVTLTCYANTDPSLDTNNRSAQIMIRYRDRTILFMADMEKPGQTEMLKRVPAGELKADLLKYPHHGKSAMNEEFFRAVSPQAAIITNKIVNDWKGVIYLKKRWIPHIYTNRDKVYLHLMTDGSTWVIERVPQEDVGSV